MIEAHQNWFIAVKKVEAISDSFEQELISKGVGVQYSDEYIHAHFFIPEDVYPHANTTLQEQGFTLSDQHPPTCSIGLVDDFEVFEKRVSIIEVREANALKNLFDQGVSMSGGAGKPHIHVKIPSDKREEVIDLLAQHQYYYRADIT